MGYEINGNYILLYFYTGEAGQEVYQWVNIEHEAIRTIIIIIILI